MGFLIGSMLFVVVVVLVHASSPCAIPALLKGNMLELTYAAGDIKQPIVVKSDFIYDANAKRIYKHTKKDDGKSYEAYKYYDMQQQYIIESDGTCRLESLKETFPVMAIPNPKDTVRLPNDDTIVYSGSLGIGQFVISTRGNCLPTSWTEYLPLGPRYLVKQRIYSDVSGNVDLSKVKIPAKCGLGKYVVAW